MFASSPECGGTFITSERSREIASLLEKSGCTSVHIGGGEPFMNFNALCELIEALNNHGIAVDYIETNASWCINENIVRKRLRTLRSLGVTTVMASVDPFHIEFVPLERPLLLCNILADEGMDYFIWQEKFLRRLIKLDLTRTYTKDELCAILGENYIHDTASEYGLGMNGRSLAIANTMYEKYPTEKWLTSSPCKSLHRPYHCHIDLDGNAIPSGCPGLAAEAEDYLTGNFPTEKYPVFSRLADGGIKSLYEYAVSLGFVPASEGYSTRCSLCYAIRSYLLKKGERSGDLSPLSFYDEIKKIL